MQQGQARIGVTQGGVGIAPAQQRDGQRAIADKLDAGIQVGVEQRAGAFSQVLRLRHIAQDAERGGLPHQRGSLHLHILAAEGAGINLLVDADAAGEIALDGVHMAVRGLCLFPAAGIA
ncbi:hypothetical protein HC928_17805 [bacterium]|nr:hypothetical protein [bacterium]